MLYSKFFFFQAEDGIRDVAVTGVQTCALPIFLVPSLDLQARLADAADYGQVTARDDAATAAFEPEWLPFDHPLWIVYSSRSEERRVGKEGRSRWSPYH